MMGNYLVSTASTLSLIRGTHLCLGEVTLPDSVEMVMPGDNVSATFELITHVPIEQGLRFAVREGGRTVGAGVVSKVLA